MVRAVDEVSAYVPDVHIVEHGALKSHNDKALALTSDGVIYLSDAIPAELSVSVPFHEIVHAAKQRGYGAYIDFISTFGERVNVGGDPSGVLDLVIESRYPGKTLFDLTGREIDTVYDELNAVVWGFYKDDPANARAKFAEVFTDYDGYIAEQDAIMEGARGAYAEGGRTPPGGTGAALDAGERRALEEGWRDEEPGVRAAGPYNGAKEAVGYGRGEEALTGLQGVPGADVRGGNRGPEAVDAGVPRGGDSENGGIQEAPGRGGGAGARLPDWAEGHVEEEGY